MIRLQKNYARDLLTHVNPYTGLSYANDPAVAVIEINNENSLVGFPWGDGLGSGLGVLPEPFRGELVGFWNDWLAKKYGTDERLQAAWLGPNRSPGPGLLNIGSAWSIEHQGTSEAEVIATPPSVKRRSAAPDVDVHVTKTDGTDWHVQVHQTGLTLQDGVTYTVTFRAKAEADHEAFVYAGLDQADWHKVGLETRLHLSPEWKAFRFVFTARGTVPGHSRVSLILGDKPGTVSVADFQVAAGAALPAGQSLAARTLDIPDVGAATAVQHDDWITFLSDTERSYAQEMRAYLKNDLHVHANVICSQISWGGLTGLKREASMDFADNHAYWQHPSFPHQPWDSKDWNIPNTPLVSELASGGGGTLRDLAEYRVAGKPYSVSEYNEPAPNDYRAEMMPELATFAAFQDWDMVYLFAQGDYGASAATDKIEGFFDVANDPSKTAFLPAAALIFRGGLISPAFGENNKTLPNLAKMDQTKPMAQVWQEAGKYYQPDIFNAKLAVRSGPPVGIGFSGGKPPSISVTGTASTVLFLIDGDAAVALTGYVGGRTISMQYGALTFPTFGNNFAAVTLTPRDSSSIGSSHQLLLTLVGKVENQGMGWNANRTSVGDQWGHGPVMAEGIPATMTLKMDTARRVWALDVTGKRSVEVPATFAGGVLTFGVGPQYKTLWYEIAPKDAAADADVTDLIPRRF